MVKKRLSDGDVKGDKDGVKNPLEFQKPSARV
jgi:hypothetical protein